MKKQLTVFFTFYAFAITSFAQNYPYFTWVQHATSVGFDYFNDVAVDQAGNVYAIGVFDEDISIGGDTFLIPASGNSDILFVKFDANGNYIWGQQFGSTGPDDVIRILISDQDEIFICGRVIGTAYVGTTSGGVDQYLSASNGWKGFIAKYQTSGDIVWASMIDGSFQTNPASIALDSQHNISIAGTYYATIDFGNGITWTTSAHNQLDVFVAKYNNNGVCQWAFSEGDLNADWVYDIAIDANDNFAIAGSFDDTMNLSGNILVAHGNGDAYVACYNAAGTLQWYDQAGGWSTFTVTADAANRLTFDQNNNLWITGYYMDTIIFANDTLISSGYQDIFMAQYNPGGTVLQTKTFGGSSLHDQPSAVGIDNNNNILLSGNAYYAITIDDSTINSYGMNDWMLVNFSPALTVQWIKHAGTTYNDGAGRFICNNQGDIYMTGDIGDHLTAQFDTIFVTATGTDQWYDACLAKLTFGTTESVNENEFDFLDNYLLYPNPASSAFYIRGITQKTALHIYDAQGQLVMNTLLQPGQPVQTDLLPAGLYYIQLPEARNRIKFIKL